VTKLILRSTAIGLRVLLDDAGRAFTTQAYAKMMRGRAEHWAFRQMLYRLRGSAVPCWLPTFNEDLVLSRSRLSGDSLIDIKKIGYVYTGGNVDGRNHVLINGTITREIIGTGAAPSSAEERLTLGSALGTALPAETTASFLEIGRLSADAVEIMHHTDTDGVAECSLAFRAFRDERVAEDPISYPIPGAAQRTAPCGEVFSQILNINAQSNAVFPSQPSTILTKGITISGFDPSNVLKLTLPPGQMYVAWSPWGRPAYSGSQPATSGSSNRLHVIKDGNTAVQTTFQTAGPYGTYGQFNGYEAARAAWGEHYLTGASSYTFFIEDTPIYDNSGGLSVLVELI
jgi:hypothetical protein